MKTTILGLCQYITLINPKFLFTSNTEQDHYY